MRVMGCANFPHPQKHVNRSGLCRITFPRYKQTVPLTDHRPATASNLGIDGGFYLARCCSSTVVANSSVPTAPMSPAATNGISGPLSKQPPIATPE